jgi:hypothetical protein
MYGRVVDEWREGGRMVGAREEEGKLNVASNGRLYEWVAGGGKGWMVGGRDGYLESKRDG